jgi:16S rRNA (cytosine1402-N4)-methyltransferase
MAVLAAINQQHHVSHGVALGTQQWAALIRTGGAETAMMTLQPAPQSSFSHAPVMLAEALAGLAVRPGGRYIDATFGGGGHTAAILDAGGQVLAIDADPAAVERAARLRSGLIDPERLIFAAGNFGSLASIAQQHGFDQIDGVLFDFGLSSFQLDDPERGFAFRFDGPLDMRMNPQIGMPASELIARLSETELARLIREFGEEPRARQIARGIVAEREKAPIDTTTRLAAVIEQSVGGRRGARIHPATKAFQAIRIAVNDEIGAIDRGVQAAIDLLAPGGRLVTIAFHSLEDRPVKAIIAAESATCICPPEQPICTCGAEPRLKRVGGSKRSSDQEIAHNPRARSAVMRVAERLPGGKRADRGDR